MKFSSFIITAISTMALADKDNADSRNLRGGAVASSRQLMDFAALNDSLEQLRSFDATAAQNVEKYHPVFDFDGDSCLPSAGISRYGQTNPGLGVPSGSVTEGCRSYNFMQTSNTYHRWDRVMYSGITFEMHIFDLYFEKDQAGSGSIGHRHDVESVIMLFYNNQPVFVSVSAHGNYHDNRTRRWEQVPKQGDHPRVVYHKEGGLTHAFRFAGDQETHAENPTGSWVMPKLASWYHMEGDSGWTNWMLRHWLNSEDFGSASFKVVDANVSAEAEKARHEYGRLGMYVPPFDFLRDTENELHFFSEEGSAHNLCQYWSPSAMLSGLRCRGRFCDDLQIRCSNKSNAQLSGEFWTEYFSEEQGLRTCAGGNRVVTGIRCKGSYCDNIQLQCKDMNNIPINFGNCHYSNWVSEEGQGGAMGYEILPDNTFPIGVECRGRYCDDKRIYYCYA